MEFAEIVRWRGQGGLPKGNQTAGSQLVSGFAYHQVSKGLNRTPFTWMHVRELKSSATNSCSGSIRELFKRIRQMERGIENGMRGAADSG